MDIFDFVRVKNRIYLKLINTEWSKRESFIFLKQNSNRKQI